MIVGIESRPNLLPAECVFTSHGSGSCDKFIRVQLPENYYWDNVLISDHFFKQMADEMGYVRKDKQHELLEELREEARIVSPNLNGIVDTLAELHDKLQRLEVFEQRITKFAASLESFRHGEGTDEQDSSGESTGLPEPTASDTTFEQLFAGDGPVQQNDSGRTVGQRRKS